MDTEKTDNLLELPQLILSSLIIVASLIIAIFLGAKTDEPTLEEPSRYERLLVQLYSTTKDRETIRFIEARITPEQLALFSDDEQKAYKERYWGHFKENPLDYWFFSSIASVGTLEPMLAVVIEEREGELINIIKNRDQYIADTNKFFYLFQSLNEEKIIPVEIIVERTEENIATAREALSINKPDLAVIALNEIKYNLNTYELTGSNQEALSNLFFLKPRYEPIVYGCFNPYSNLYDIARVIIADRDEDLTLRLTAANYLLDYVKEKDEVVTEQEEFEKEKQKLLDEMLILYEELDENQSAIGTKDDYYAESVVRRAILTVLEELR